MAIRVALNHYTRYRYDKLVSLSPHIVRLRPAPHCRTPFKPIHYELRQKNILLIGNKTRLGII